jgi:UDP-N-acetylmuramate dehydrogenase
VTSARAPHSIDERGLDAVARALKQCMRGRVERELPLARYTTYKLGGPAALYLEPADASDLRTAATVIQDSEIRGLAVLTLGRGSNVVVSDEGWPGVVVRLAGGFADIAADEGEPETVAVGASATLPLLANWAARRGLSGLEWGVAVPGSIGGAVRMNAGAHGSDMAATAVGATVFEWPGKAPVEREADDLGLAYRSSSLNDGDIVLRARVHLAADDEGAIRARMETFRRHRATTQPGAVQNAGSTFKNPPGDAAGRVVEAAGLKGFRVGGARVSELHANFFMAPAGATAQDVFALVQEVRARVNDAFGVELEPEVRFVGRFDEPAARGAEVVGR